MTGATNVRLVVLCVDRADAHLVPTRRDGEPVPRMRLAGEHRAGDHQSRALEMKAAVDGKTKSALDRSHRILLRRTLKKHPEFRNTGVGQRGDRKHVGIRECGGGRERLDRIDDFGDSLFVDPVNLGDRDDATPDVEKVEDRQMLLGLGHRAVVGRHDQQREIDAGDARQHVADEALVSRDVDKPDGRTVV